MAESSNSGFLAVEHLVGEGPVVECVLCPHHCRLAEGQTGRCQCRSNHQGRISSDNYGVVTALALDPIEKKPLYHFSPGANILSVGSFGCNLHCPFCQNSRIAAAGKELLAQAGQAGGPLHLTPGQLIALAEEEQKRGNIGLAYTYNEPLVGYEFVQDCAKLALERGLQNVLVTNGMIAQGPWQALLPLIQAVNIDLKGFTTQFYRKLGGDLAAVQEAIVAAAAVCHVEVTTLIVPGENDSEEEMVRMSSWLAGIDPAIPYHISRFFPRWRMQDRPATPVATVRHLAAVARQKLRYVYEGNC